MCSRFLCLAPVLLCLSCGGEDRTAEPAGEASEEAANPALTRLDDWATRILAAGTDGKKRGKLLYQLSGDESVPAYEALELIDSHRPTGGTMIGCYVRLMSPVRESDPVEATRCFEVIEHNPGLDAILHGLGRELGRQAPAHGLEWLSRREWSRAVYFAAVNLGSGFAEFAATHPIEDVEPLFDAYLASPLFDGQAYDDEREGEGSRMRERMADAVLEQLARAGKLSDELAVRLHPKLPLKCLPHLGSYPVHAWDVERILTGFRTADFPEDSRVSATLIALEHLMDTEPFLKALEWTGDLEDPRARKLATEVAIKHYLDEGNDRETMVILESMDLFSKGTNEDLYQYALKWAKVKARDSRNEPLGKKIKQFEDQRRAGERRR